MSALEAFILGVIQGFTEFLPISSSGHLELGKAVLGVEVKEDISFALVVHAATVLSTIVVFNKQIIELTKGVFQLKWNESAQYVGKLVISAIPVGIIGLLFKEEIEALFNKNVLLVGIMLLVTGGLLAFTYYAKKQENEVSYFKSLWIGIAQAIAVLPGISRSGATISTALLLGVKKETATAFSFLMVLAPILAANVKDAMDGGLTNSQVGIPALLIGFITAFISGIVACKWMIGIVQKGKLIYFSIYCFVVGTISIVIACL